MNAALFIVAGSETTASSLASLCNNVLRYPQKYAKLKAEIRGAFQKEEDISLEKVMGLEYLSACLEENLRMFPPAPIGFLRSINPGGDTIDGEFLPGGVSLFKIASQKITNIRYRHQYQYQHGVRPTVQKTSRIQTASFRKDGLRITRSLHRTRNLRPDHSRWALVVVLERISHTWRCVW